MGWYRTGTIAGTSGTNVITGTGTTFNDTAAGVNPGDMLIVGGLFYEIATVVSATSLTLATNLTATIAAGTSYQIVTSTSMSNASLAKKVAAAYDRILTSIANWMTILTGSGTVSITPYGASNSYSGLAWPSMTTAINAAAVKDNNLSDLGNLSTAWSNLLTARTPATARADLGFNVTGGLVPVTLGGTGAANSTTARSNLGMGTSDAVFFGSLELSAATPYIDFHYGSSTSDYTHRLIASSTNTLGLTSQFLAQGGYVSRAGSSGATDEAVPWNFYWNYNSVVSLAMFIGTGYIGQVTTTISSDIHLKKDIEYTSDKTFMVNDVEVSDKAAAAWEVGQWKTATFKYMARGEYIPESKELLGFIANQLKGISPETVDGEGLPDDYDIEKDPNNPNAYTLNQVAILAKQTLAIQYLLDKVSELETKLANSETSTQ